MKKIFILSLVLFGFHSYAQVGIGTTAPAATLDIVAANPTGLTTGVDGILIPRVTRERAQAMTAVPTSTIIYVNEVVTGTATGNAVNITAVGFYHYDGVSNTWKNLSSTGVIDADWYKFGTTATPTAITDDMFHTGDVSIGKNTASTSKLDISESLTARNTVVKITHTTPNTAQTNLIENKITSNAVATAANPYSLCGVKNILSGTTKNGSSGTIFHKRYGVYNDLSSANDGGFYYGMYNIFDVSNGTASLTNQKVGIHNEYSGTAVARSIGIENRFNCNEPVSTGPKFGMHNIFDGSTGLCTGTLNSFNNTAQQLDQIGLQNKFVSNNAGGLNNYGVYNDYVLGGNTGNYGVYNKISSTGATSAGSGYGVYVDATASLGTGQGVYGIYSTVPNNGDQTSKRFAGYFVGAVSIGTTISPAVSNDTYILPLKRGTNANFGQVPITTGGNSNREVIWSPFSFQNTAATSVIAKYFSAFTSATDWVNGTTRVYTITDSQCITSSSISVSITNGTVATADDFTINSVSTANGEFYVTVTNVSGADIAGGYSIPFAFTAFY